MSAAKNAASTSAGGQQPRRRRPAAGAGHHQPGAVTGTAATAASVFAPHLLARYVGRRTDHQRLGTDYPAAQPSPPSTADVRKGDQCDVIAGQSTSHWSPFLTSAVLGGDGWAAG